MRPSKTSGIGCKRRCRSSQRSGFSLLEVILALATLAGSIAVIGEMSRLSLRNAAYARDLARAQLLCDSKMSEIVSGITSPTPVERSPFDTSTEVGAADNPKWIFSIDSDPTDEDGLISVRVTVTLDVAAAQHPAEFTLVRWMPDPNAASQSSSNNQSGGQSSGSSSGSSQGGSNGS